METTRTGNDLISAAQTEMRHAYFGGGPGMLTSAAAWAAAAVATVQLSPQRAIWVLFAGGMLIHPVAVLLCRAAGRPGSHSKGNPFGGLALAGTVWMILCLPLAYGVSLQRMEWFFPAMLLVIGGRYLTFSTMYGRRIYWVCGFALAGAGYVLGRMGASPTLGAAAGAGIEAAFALAILQASLREGQVAPAVA